MAEKYIVVLYKLDGIGYRRVGECKSNDAGFADWPALEQRHKAEVEKLRARILELEASHEEAAGMVLMIPAIVDDACEAMEMAGMHEESAYKNLKALHAELGEMLTPNVQAEGAAHALSRSSLRAPGSASRDSEKGSREAP